MKRRGLFLLFSGLVGVRSHDGQTPPSPPVPGPVICLHVNPDGTDAWTAGLGYYILECADQTEPTKKPPSNLHQVEACSICRQLRLAGKGGTI